MNGPFKMDEQSIFDILECSVCLERLDATSRVLPCQHTFCMRCLQQILNTRGELRCPECRDLAPQQRVTDLPTNILLVRLLDGMKRPAPASPSTGSSSGGGLSKTSDQADTTSSSRSGVSKISGPNQPCAKAIYKYDGQESGDLSFNKGAVVLLLKRIDDNWYHGELDGSRGFFPASYVEVLVPLPPDPPQCKALYDFDVNEQEEKDCLTFNKDEVLMVIRRVDENWIEGQKGDKIGIFPISFVELNDTAKSLVDVNAGATGGDAGASEGQGGSSSSQESGSSKNKSSNKRHSFTSMLGVQLRSKESQDRGSGGGGGGGGSGGGGGDNRHSMEISSPVLLRSSNPTAATLIEAKAAAVAVAMATGGPSPASSPSPSSSPLPVAAASGSAAQTGGSKKKPAPLTLNNQPTGAGLPPNSPTLIASGPATPTHLTTHDTPSSPKPKVEVYVAMFNYKPLNPDEIELRKGEFYTVTEKCKDGWFKGLSVSSGQIGVFPGNYMQVYRHDRQEKQKKSAPSSSISSSSSSTPSSSTFTSSSLLTSTASSSRSASASSQSTTPNSALSGQSGSSGAGSGEKKQFLPDGQKTVAQLQSERAALRMQYQGATQGAISRPIQAPQTRLNERQPQSSPPSVGVESSRLGGSVASSAMAGSWPGNAQAAQPGVGHRQVHTAVQTSNANAQTVRPRTANPTAATINASQPGSPPVSHGIRTHIAGAADVQPGVPVRQACSQMVVPHQKEKKERKSKKPSNKHVTSNEAPELGSNRTTSPSRSAMRASATHSPNSSKSSSPDNHQGEAPAAESPAGAMPGGGEGGARGGDTGAATTEQTPPKTTPLLRERYRVIVPYPPTTDAELELKIGDTVFVHKKREDGWFKGTLHRTGKTGLFPGSFAEPY
ncbi:E3 ubiquitin-protein ligase SH3RF1-like isoform X2 [Lytechinus variegatus]|uniref:E3 ubiquitin-protein ligase SH3RF1-like isoform X2 n=1 Tax=Lytechinus variegatus TaxID=7654 RepID=UPI001BB1F2A1|nr:E3 ubiquitin-protein ligase SH3RF1-like isoform X2 [Lytechinus variegatus]